MMDIDIVRGLHIKAMDAEILIDDIVKSLGTYSQIDGAVDRHTIVALVEAASEVYNLRARTLRMLREMEDADATN